MRDTGKARSDGTKAITNFDTKSSVMQIRAKPMQKPMVDTTITKIVKETVGLVKSLREIETKYINMRNFTRIKTSSDMFTDFNEGNGGGAKRSIRVLMRPVAFVQLDFMSLNKRRSKTLDIQERRKMGRKSLKVGFRDFGTGHT